MVRAYKYGSHEAQEFGCLIDVPKGFYKVIDMEAGWAWLAGSFPDQGSQWFGPYSASQMQLMDM